MGDASMEAPVPMFHEPVMVNEVLDYLQPVLSRGTIIDATVGGGGHARAILERLAGLATASAGAAAGRLLGLDIDPDAIGAAQKVLNEFGCKVADGKDIETGKADDNRLRCGPMVWLVHASYTGMAEIAQTLGLLPVAAVLFDFGVSGFQLEEARRGFSFDREGPVDMRFDQSSNRPTALSLLSKASEGELWRWFSEYGQEPMSKRIARRIHEQRSKIRTTRDLAEMVRSAVPARRARKALARVFQALRIVTNRELENVRQGIQAALGLVAAGGRVLVISYHSGEDRIAKELFRTGRQTGRLRVLTPRLVRPTVEEVLKNPRSRSARLRVVEVLA
ncbi:MAG: 16S rRNA (cytosine(1402)-N(4))-methyltransferase RsmH [candidate division WOR-3 bacterium]